jgi:hypothetical protein
MAQTTRTQRNVFWPALLIILGLVLLLANVGLLPPIAWRSFGFLWPVLLVVLGVELIATGRITWAGVLGGVVAIFILAMVAGALGLRGIGSLDRGRAGPATGVERRVEQTIDGARAADIEINHDAGRLEVTGGAREGLLAEAVASGADSDRLVRTYTVQNGVGRLRLSVEGRGLGGLFRNGDESPQLAVRLSRAVPLSSLQLNGGGSEINVDLSELQVQRLQLNAGGSNGRLRLPSRGTTAGEVNAGASNLTIEIPTGVAARIRAQGGLAAFTVDEQRFPPTGTGEGIPGLAGQREYRSADFDGNSNRADLQISAGAARVEVR